MKYKKIIEILIIFIMSLIFTNNVYAGNIEKKYALYEYYIKNETSEFSDMYYQYSIDGKNIYSLNPFIDLGDNYNISNIDNLDLSLETKNKILLIAYYGYDYEGHQSLKYKAAAQALIWEEVLGNNYKVSFHSDLYGKGFEFSIERQRDAIMELVNNYYKEPEIKNKTFNVNYGNSITIEDKLLSNYESKYEIINNSLTFTPELNDNKITFYKKNYYDYDYKIYTCDGFTNMLYAGNFDNNFFDINLNIIKGSININVIDEDNNLLDGIVFDLYDEENNYIDSYTSKNGLITIDNLKFKKYYLKEKSTNSNLELNENIYEININDNIEIKNNYKTYNVKITITDNKNIKYNLYNSNDELIDEYIPNDEGVININNLRIGNYYLKNTLNSEKQYFEINNQDIEIKIKNNLLNNNEIIIDVPNTELNELNIFPIIILFIDMLYVKKNYI